MPDSLNKAFDNIAQDTFKLEEELRDIPNNEMLMHYLERLKEHTDELEEVIEDEYDYER